MTTNSNDSDKRCACGRHDVTDMDFRHNETVHRRDKCSTWWILKIYDLEARLIEADKLIEIAVEFISHSRPDIYFRFHDAYEAYKQSTKDKE